MNEELTIEQVRAAQKRIGDTIRATPLVESAALTQLVGAEVRLKLEHLQRTGSFKLRGAANAVASLSEEEKLRGVVAVSTGNHGRGLAYAAQQAGVKCVICMSRLVPQNKIEGIQALGAETRIVGESQDDAQQEVDRLVQEEGMTMLPPFDHPAIIAGQGTLGLEIVEELPNVQTLVVPVSGGGLISGVALAARALLPNVRVVGVSMVRGAAMHASQAAGKPVLVKELPTLADSLGGGIGLDNEYTFRLVRELVEKIVLVEEGEIAAAIRHAYWEEKQVIEGSGAVGIAALMTGKIENPGRTAVILSGCNIDMNIHHRLISGEDVDVANEQ